MDVHQLTIEQWEELIEDLLTLKDIVLIEESCLLEEECHKLHLAISPPILRRFSWSQWLWKALEKTF